MINWEGIAFALPFCFVTIGIPAIIIYLVIKRKVWRADTPYKEEDDEKTN